jgi:putative OPT family oligopeptide transporter
MAYDELFSKYVRLIGIGGIFTAGFLSILKMSPVIVQAFGKVLGELARLRQRGESAVLPRTDQDIPLGRVAAMGGALAVALWVYFRFVVLAGMDNATALSLAALALTLVISFLFAAVSAWAVALISITPVSGMTLTTLIISAVLLAQLGVGGPRGQLAVLLIGGVVCTALSMTGSMVTMLKVGYWLGATPRRIQYALMGGSVLSSLTVTAVILLFAKVYGYVPGPAHPHPVAAPQANAMAAVIGSVMASDAATQTPWFLYGLGAVVAVVVQMLGISSLAFALGMYLPIDLNTPILAGAIVAWLVQRPSGDAARDRARSNRGTLIASGFIAGGALAGVFDAIVKWLEESFGWTLTVDVAKTAGWSDVTFNWLGLGVFLALGAFIYIDARRATAAEDTGHQLSL